ncbi:uncharacterized protein LOC121640502 [Melanotaenia boesemani]|uniref:uncharacterized protein LOC121640502 n=1 Tax=Melanotaenia boesemani TaxID=1250792 RepID=UPI001C04FE8E|nr:uncharacterized protein LOC121640502 [Melanotaenia boesemani]
MKMICWFLISVLASSSSCKIPNPPPTAGQTNITAEPGHDVSLPCRAGHDGDIISVHWIRPDLDPEYVLLYRNGRFNLFHQHPSFQNRVDIQDRQMKDGDVSLILKNLTINDTGTYECRVLQKGTNTVFTKSIIHLEVSPPGTTQDGGDKDGGDKDGGDNDGGDKDGGHNDGGDKDGGHNDGGDKDGEGKDGDDEDVKWMWINGFSLLCIRRDFNSSSSFQPDPVTCKTSNIKVCYLLHVLPSS